MRMTDLTEEEATTHPLGLKRKGCRRRKKESHSDSDGKMKEGLSDTVQSYTDFMCPICLRLIIKPVVLPCHHELCMPCFDHHISETSLQCPMCRKRISAWARRKKKEGNFVDEKRWALIQRLFPERCKRRLNGDDDSDEEDVLLKSSTPVIATSGEIREEYEKELAKIRKEQEQESLASEEAVQKLLEEEQRFANIHFQQEKEDEDLALLLQQEEVKQTRGILSLPSQSEKEILHTFGHGQLRELRNSKLPSTTSSLSRKGQKNSSRRDGRQTIAQSSTSRHNSPGDSKTPPMKENAQISKWFSKEGSSCSSSKEATPRTSLFTKLQEERDRDLAMEIQQQLNAEAAQLSRNTIEDHFYPLRDKRQNSSSAGGSKRQRLQ